MLRNIEHLERGEIALTIGFPKGDEPGIYARRLFAQDWAVVLRKGHPALRRKWTPELYASLSHVLVTATGRGQSSIDELLAAEGLTRRIHARVLYPLVAPLLVTNSDLSVTTLRFLAMQLARAGALVVKQPPFAVPPARVPMLWHERSHEDPRHRWLREQVAVAAASLSPKMLRG